MIAVLKADYKFNEGTGHTSANSNGDLSKIYFGTHFYSSSFLTSPLGASTDSTPDTVNSPAWTSDVVRTNYYVKAE